MDEEERTISLASVGIDPFVDVGGAALFLGPRMI